MAGSETTTPTGENRAMNGNAMQISARVAVFVPAYNEAASIVKVIEDFRAVLPDADIYVYDNNSTDDTAALARQVGAKVYLEKRQGKGNVVRRAFADIDADVYIMADGDGTYHAPSVVPMIEMLIDQSLDMVVGVRQSEEKDAYRRGHRFGNRMLNWLVHLGFGKAFRDMLSGYRVMSRRFVKTYPGIASGFEIETELTVHALEMRMPCAEVDTPYYSRPEGSESKLSTYRDGVQILWMILRLLKSWRPMVVFSWIAIVLFAMALILIVPVVVTFFETGIVLRIPTVILSGMLIVLALIAVTTGVVLQSVSRAAVETKRLAYLGFRGAAQVERRLGRSAG